MPLLDLMCSNKECENHKKIDEVLVGVKEERPKCALCGAEQEIIMSACSLNTVGCSAASKFGIH